MSSSVFAGNKNHSYDPGLIIKDVADYYGQFIRTGDAKSLNSGYFTHLAVAYNGDNNPTQVTYYRGDTAHITQIGCLSDVAGSLNNTYLQIFAAPSNKSYHLWINVDNTGTEPIVANSTGIEINISANDPALVVSMAITLTINTLFSSVFIATRISATVEINTVGLGISSNTSDFSTGFVILNTQGSQTETSSVSIDYDGLDPIYNGQLMKDYYYDIYSGKFVRYPVNSSAVSNVIVQNKLFTKPYNKLSVLSKNDDGNPLEVETYLAGNPVQLATLQYDSDGDFLEVEVDDL